MLKIWTYFHIQYFIFWRIFMIFKSVSETVLYLIIICFVIESNWNFLIYLFLQSFDESNLKHLKIADSLISISCQRLFLQSSGSGYLYVLFVFPQQKVPLKTPTKALVVSVCIYPRLISTLQYDLQGKYLSMINWLWFQLTSLLKVPRSRHQFLYPSRIHLYI